MYPLTPCIFRYMIRTIILHDIFNCVNNNKFSLDTHQNMHGGLFFNAFTTRLCPPYLDSSTDHRSSQPPLHPVGARLRIAQPVDLLSSLLTLDYTHYLGPVNWRLCKTLYPLSVFIHRLSGPIIHKQEALSTTMFVVYMSQAWHTYLVVASVSWY